MARLTASNGGRATAEAVSHYREANALAGRLATSKKKAEKDQVRRRRRRRCCCCCCVWCERAGQVDTVELVSIKRKYAGALLNVGAFDKANVELVLPPHRHRRRRRCVRF